MASSSGRTDGLSSDLLHTLNTCITEHANYFDQHNDDCGLLVTCTHTHTHTHTHKPKSDVGKDTKQRSTSEEWQVEIIATGNRGRGANDNVEYDWGRFMGFLHMAFCMERQIFPAPTQCYD